MSSNQMLQAEPQKWNFVELCATEETDLEKSKDQQETEAFRT